MTLRDDQYDTFARRHGTALISIHFLPDGEWAYCLREQQQGDYDSKQTCQQTTMNVSALNTQGEIFFWSKLIEYTQEYRFPSFFVQYTDIGDNTNHDGRYHKWDGDKGDQYIAG